MQTNAARGLKCFKYLLTFYLVLSCILGLCITVFAAYLLIFKLESYISKAKNITLYFLIAPALFTILSAVLGWSSIKRKNINLLKFFAVILAFMDILQIAGCLWCFTSLPAVNEQVLVNMKEKFSVTASDTHFEKWWNDIQFKLKCCGLHGPTDYLPTKVVPISCCGTDSEDKTGSCSFLWQKGCSQAMTKELSKDFILIGLVGLGIAFLQLPGVFIIWCFANRLSKETL